MDAEFNRTSLRRRVQAFVNRLLPDSFESRRTSRRMRQYVQCSAKDILDLLAYEQIASLMGTTSDFEDIRSRKVTLQLRIADEITNGDLTMAEIRRMDPQVQNFIMDVMKARGIEANDAASDDEDKKPQGLRKRLTKMLSQKSLI
ncbi:unnamed protein product [Bursaphelenchus xylophilus]|uniref:(pine wood nematode) hypothetical protein n=1 Tax=Bursaphelenchus xylophilus TaxID=6326 RepID=A0A1I7SBX6_BURXY|nr:unnamed protein product [Bursaphelenchus xylophilus]CAG9089103.1 unnamed protein product [Bursaphelenchus xylophilus]